MSNSIRRPRSHFCLPGKVGESVTPCLNVLRIFSLTSRPEMLLKVEVQWACPQLGWDNRTFLNSFLVPEKVCAALESIEILHYFYFWKLLAAAAAAKSLQSCPTLCDPWDGSPPGSPVPGILQARTLEWVAISFSNALKWKVKVKLLSRVWLWTIP